MSDPILTLLAVSGTAPERASLEALSLARGLARTSESTVEVVVVADPAAARSAVAALAGFGVAVAIVVEHSSLTTDHPDAWAEAVVQVIAARRPAAVVGAGTERGNDLLARIAARLSLPMAANCVSVEAGERYRLTRQRWAAASSRIAGSMRRSG